ncbi:MAG: ABC transporter permease [Verrucomicrobiia bacterium]
MAETEKAGKKIWIGVAILVIGTALTGYFVPWLWASVLIPSAKAVGRFGAAIGQHLTSSVTVSWWSLWILIVLSAVVLLQVAAFFRRQMTAADRDSPQGLHREDFRTLNYEGIRWIWKYSFSGEVLDIVALCPVCSYQLDLKHDARPNPHTMIGLTDVTIYWCDHCNVVKAQLDGNQKAITVRVHKEVLRLFNSGEWEEVVRQQMTARSQNNPQP